jgi:hypothetical protein
VQLKNTTGYICVDQLSKAGGKHKTKPIGRFKSFF